MTHETNGWHINDQVYIQARSGPLVLVQYVQRAHVYVWDGPNKSERRKIPKWAWVPVEDVIYNWEVRQLA